MARKARILAIDDQLYFRRFVEGLLAEEGHAVRTAESLAAGVADLREHGADLVVLDPLAAGDRERAIAAVRELAPRAAVVVLSGGGDVATVVRAMREGAADYLLKPVDRESLLAAIDAALAERPPPRAPAARTSLDSRVLELFAEPELGNLAQGILELLCLEIPDCEAALWVREGRGSGLALAATRGDAARLDDTLAWKTRDEQLDARIRAGEIVELDDSVLVPLTDQAELVAVARLEPGAPPGSLSGGQRVCASLLRNWRRLETLRSESLREPETGLPSRKYLEKVLDTEVHKAARFGRRLACLAIELASPLEPSLLAGAVRAMERTLRTTDVLCSERARRFWVLVTDTDSLGGVVLKRRLSERIVEALRAEQPAPAVALGVASYPHDGETPAELTTTAIARVNSEKGSVIHTLGLRPQSSLGEIGARLIRQGVELPRRLVFEAAELLVSELTCRPRDRGLLFFAPGPEAAAVLGPLAALGDTETATEIFVATDGDTAPSSASVTAVALPAQVSPEETWIVRFGEAPPYALVAGPPAEDGTRSVYHTCDSVLVEHMTFRLRAEVGFGVTA